MKLAANKVDENIEKQAGPKLRNINEEKKEPEEKLEGADGRLKICTAVLLVFVLFIAIKGYFTNSSLTSQIEKQQKQLTEVQAEALLYGITKDDNGELIIPDITSDNLANTSNLEPGSIEERNKNLLDSFTALLLNWKGQSGYNKVRQTLKDDWSFPENSKLLSSFMPKSNEELDANMSLSGYTTFILSNDNNNISYFLICTVRNTINGTSASGTVGIQITINEDGTLAKITAQTLS